MMAAMRHPNVVLYLGVCLDPPCVVTEYCARGSLNDVLKRALYNSKYAEQLDWRVRCGLTPAPSHTASCMEAALVHTFIIDWHVTFPYIREACCAQVEYGFGCCQGHELPAHVRPTCHPSRP